MREKVAILLLDGTNALITKERQLLAQVALVAATFETIADDRLASQEAIWPNR
ncbi:hypothetical protein U1708_07670 [Sphingomonas sp. ZB1N12]|uniref:hypothetical protein n=1 Tax=Sphingomonas arabinosi TaxID=3096160 RepID=UPI002FCAC141